MNQGIVLLIGLATIIFSSCGTTKNSRQEAMRFYEADNPHIQYIGRVEFANPKLPRFWSPGVYITARFKGPDCSVIINDEMLWGNSHNYIAIVIDGKEPVRIKLKSKTDTIQAATGLSKGEHTIMVCKNTESGIGYLEFAGIQCKELLPPPAKPVRKIECIGNSITCGTGSDLSDFPATPGSGTTNIMPI